MALRASRGPTSVGLCIIVSSWCRCGVSNSIQLLRARNLPDTQQIVTHLAGLGGSSKLGLTSCLVGAALLEEGLGDSDLLLGC